MAVAACCLVDLHSLAGLASFEFVASFADFDPKYKHIESIKHCLKPTKPPSFIRNV